VRRVSQRRVVGLVLAALVVIGAVVGFGACGSDNGSTGGESIEHVHGLGVNPRDGALFIATHAGLFRSPEESTTAERVGESTQDTMGFTVVGPDRFLGSGHPGAAESGPPSLGLIESDDAGASWQQVSLEGEADFHILRYAHGRVYGFNGLSGKLMLSDDGGRDWSERTPPGPMIDLAVDPEDPERILVSTDEGLSLSEDDGESWRPVKGEIGLLAWPAPGTLFSIDADGRVALNSEPGDGWRERGSIGGSPAALTSLDNRTLFAALFEGGVVSSSDGGKTWRPRTSS
jgi:photosystem II stability/assembly factor-like uncharacterized protein